MRLRNSRTAAIVFEGRLRLRSSSGFGHSHRSRCGCVSVCGDGSGSGLTGVKGLGEGGLGTGDDGFVELA